MSERLTDYYSITYMENALKRSNSYIYSALLKNGHSNFSLEILEYCEPSKCLEREKYYIYLLGAEYNIVKDPTLPPMSGRTHYDATKIIMSDAKKGENHPNYGKTLSDETNKIISDANKGENNPNYGKTLPDETKTKISDAKKGQPKPEGSGKPSQQIEVIDIKNNTTTSYDSISEVEIALNINRSVIVKYFSRNQKKTAL